MVGVAGIVLAAFYLSFLAVAVMGERGGRRTRKHGQGAADIGPWPRSPITVLNGSPTHPRSAGEGAARIGSPLTSAAAVSPPLPAAADTPLHMEEPTGYLAEATVGSAKGV